jgi:hypothetical protein
MRAGLGARASVSDDTSPSKGSSWGLYCCEYDAVGLAWLGGLLGEVASAWELGVLSRCACQSRLSSVY